MSNIWIILVVLYGVFKGLREGVKKKAMEKNSMGEVLFFYTLLGFIISIPFAGNPFDIPLRYYFYTAFKSFVIFLCWILSFGAVKKMPVGYYGILDMARVLFSTLLGVLVLNEALSAPQIVGMALVASGLLLVNLRRSAAGERVGAVYIIMALVSCMLNSVSALLDKLLLTTGEISSGQLQFWFMFFMAVMYFAYMSLRGNMPRLKNVRGNFWIVLLSVLLIAGDRALFIANEMPQSKLTVMTVIKQCAVIVTIIEGKLMFNESRFFYKLFCAFVIIGGIVISIL